MNTRDILFAVQKLALGGAPLVAPPVPCPVEPLLPSTSSRRERRAAAARARRKK